MSNTAKSAALSGAAPRGASTGQILVLLLTPVLIGGAIYISMALAGLDPLRVLVTCIPSLAGWVGVPPYAQLPPLAARIAAAWLALGVIGGWLAWQRLRIDPTEDRHLSGRRLVSVPRRTRAIQEALCKREGRGIPLGTTAEGVEIPLTLAQETRHLFAVGGTGAGKTTAIRPLIDAARRRMDKCLIYDNKNDFYRALPDSDDLILIAPWDRRGWRWDVARDVRTRADAAALAEALIPDSGSDPFWASASRAVAVALIHRLQKERPERWRFRDLADLVSRGFEEVRASVADYYPEAILLLDGGAGAEEEGAAAANKTAQSILANLVAGLTQVFQLIDAWDRCEVGGAISIRDWLSDDYTGPRTIVISGNEALAPLRRAVAQSIIGVIRRTVSSPEMPDSSDRRIWLFLDEFPQLGRLDSFGQFLEIGRSKGIRVVLGLQSLAQIRAVYSEDELQVWSSIIGSWLIGRTGGREDDGPRWLAGLIGDREVLRWLPSTSRARVRVPGAPAPTVSESWQQIRVPVVPPEEFGRLRAGEFFFLSLGEGHVHRFRFRPLSADELSTRRPHFEPAAWLDPSWPESAADQVAAAIGATPAAQRDPDRAAREAEDEEEEREDSHPDERLIVEATRGRALPMPADPAAGGDGVLADAITRAEVEQVAHALDAILPGAGAVLEALHLADELCGEPAEIDRDTLSVRRQPLDGAPTKRRRKRRRERDERDEIQREA